MQQPSPYVGPTVQPFMYRKQGTSIVKSGGRQDKDSSSSKSAASSSGDDGSNGDDGGDGDGDGDDGGDGGD